MLLREFFNNIQLQELFNFSYPYRLIVDNYYLSFDYWEKKYEADTKIGKLQVLFMIKKTIIIEFSIEGAYDITGLANGEQFKILSTVWNIISNELPKFIDNTINTIKFTAEHDELSRVSLYRKIVPKINTLLGSEWKDSEDEDEESVIFLWKRLQPNNQTLVELGNTNYPMVEIEPGNFIADTALGKLDLIFEKINHAIYINFKINAQYKLSGKAKQGEQYKILSTVWKIIQQKLISYIDDNINEVSFSSYKTEPSRISLYEKMIPKINKLLGSEWKFEKRLDDPFIDFVWVKQKSNDQTLLELFNFSYPYTLSKTVIDDGYIQKQYIAKTPIGVLKVDISKNINVVDFSFSINNRYDITREGNGEQFRILGTVSEIIKNHLVELIDDDVKMIYFDADSAESSRIKLYKRIAPKITKLLGSEWKFKIDNVDGAILYVWERDMKISEVITEGLSREDAGQIIDKFLEFAKTHLELEQLPTINKIGDSNYSIEYHSFGGYNPSDKTINVMISNRHIQDLLRTLAHELVHYKQDLNNELDNNSGSDGSPQENQANAQAAVIMRKWGKQYPKLFSFQAVE